MESILFPNVFEQSTHDPLALLLRDLWQQSAFSEEHWRVKRSEDAMWVYFHPRRIELPEQGWKLHVAADHASAEEVLRLIFPLLLTEEVSFKVTATLQRLAFLNRGDGGSSQIGKFVTIYPE